MVREMSISWFGLWALGKLSHSHSGVAFLGCSFTNEGTVWARRWAPVWCHKASGWKSCSEARPPRLLEKCFFPWSGNLPSLATRGLVGVSSLKEILTWPWTEGLCQNRGWRKRRRNAFKRDQRRGTVREEAGVARFQGCEECARRVRGTQGSLSPEYQSIIKGHYSCSPLTVTPSLGWYSYLQFYRRGSWSWVRLSN